MFYKSVTLFDSSFSQYEYYLKYLSGETSMLNLDSSKTSNKYFILLFWLFISIRILSNSSTIFLLTLFLFGWKLFKIFLIYLFLETYDKYLTKINKWFLDRNDVFKPKLVDILVKLFLKGKPCLKSWSSLQCWLLYEEEGWIQYVHRLFHEPNRTFFPNQTFFRFGKKVDARTVWYMYGPEGSQLPIV